jgi:nitrate reductase gamma subunit
LVAAATVSGAVVALIVAGSAGLRHFDWALLPYAAAIVFSAGAVAYRYAAWLKRPPTRRYWTQGWRLLRSRPLHYTWVLLHAVGGQVVTQRFIGRRSRQRWLAHLCLSWGTLLAFSITFPLVVGGLHFETPPDDLSRYRAIIFGIPAKDLTIPSIAAFIVFNSLNLSAVMVLIGVGLAVGRRLTDSGPLAAQRAGHDLLPLLLLFVVAVTGLGLTVSSQALGGEGIGFIAVAHTGAVVVMLLYLPFGKLFHVFQRSAQLAVAMYRDASAREERAACARCHQPYTSRRQRDDVRQVLRDVGLDPSLTGICPRCRRCLWGVAQGRLLGRG